MRETERAPLRNLGPALRLGLIVYTRSGIYHRGSVIVPEQFQENEAQNVQLLTAVKFPSLISKRDSSSAGL